MHIFLMSAWLRKLEEKIDWYELNWFEIEKLLVWAFAIVFFKKFFFSTISFNVFVFSCASSKFAEKQLINNNCII